MHNPPINLSAINNFERESNKKAGIISFFCDWSCSFPTQDLKAIVDYKAVPLITWEPWLINDKDKISLDSIIKRKWDEYIASWAKEAKDFGYPFFLR
ncbi:MAG: hypothetical protein DRP84_12460 [Spirochaetes bacterium]|nr:MAG: hypothetical protein DRP84_12460 [Spirochaetota bacterium]